MGHWIDVPYSAANFGATGGTWTVTAGNVGRFSYALVGKTAFIVLTLDGSVTTGAPTSLNLVLPFTMLGNQTGAFHFYVNPTAGVGVYQQPSQDQFIRLSRDLFATPFAAASGVALRVSLTVQIL
jgi:hypothetical protein